MKLLLALLLAAAHVQAATLTWNPNPPEERVTHYNVWISRSNVVESVAVKGTNYVITEMAAGEKASLWVTAVNAAGESIPSATVAYVEPTPSPTPGPVTGIVLLIPPPSPNMARAMWSRLEKEWRLSLEWLPVPDVARFVVTIESSNGTVSTNMVTGTTWYRNLAFTNNWRIWLQSSNSNGISPRNRFIESPK